MTSGSPQVTSVIDLLDRALLAMAANERRTVIGIAGPPGAGKSLLAHALVGAARDRVADGVIALPMDGFHLSNARLSELSLHDRKGAPETFDADGFIHKLHELVTTPGPMSWPEYSRSLHEPVPDALVIDPDIRLTFVEGNYLVLDQPPWDRVTCWLDQLWYLPTDAAQLRERLLLRQLEGGRSREQAERHVDVVDMNNALTVERCRGRASHVVSLSTDDPSLQDIVDPATGRFFALRY